MNKESDMTYTIIHSDDCDGNFTGIYLSQPIVYNLARKKPTIYT